MIKAIIFDLDGTLIQTEVLKASSYAKAVNSITKGEITEDQVLTVFGKYVGLSRSEVVEGIYKEFLSAFQKHLLNLDTDTIKKIIIDTRLSLYHKMLNDEHLLAQHFCPFNLGLLHKASNDDFHVVLATMSHLKEVEKVVTLMEINDKLDLILTRDDVAEGKPNPEIYLKAKTKLNLNSDECLVIEDSTNGIRAGLDAGMHVFAVTNDVTRTSVHSSKLLKPEYIIDDLEELNSKVYGFINSKM
ncbi:HAD family hydrolase [uncultured Croceitalea sp.]|uniref:HAD family hydrolase n=1 Tax=uncultured Croceitalea sp. TaxID=1798908 RepID=UPI00374E3B14